ncbi:MAG: MoxR family ATPase [Chloroflexi bacterium]|nr:MoxR family ATPase [Chloroflexota bacterium]MBK6712963.1 MoxR family ATPase [Chloroflexota bacterium]MBK7918879.1 MoxR family ATPase [Chloroflexota bacterium]MBP7590588.1 MoxR family ATPase [Chloroflexota bacterium]
MIAETAAKLRKNIQKVIVGKDEIIDLALIAMLCEGHILLEDVPGTGKTTLAKTIAASLGCTFRRVQFTPDLLPSDVTGIYYYNQKAQEFEFRAGPVFAQILLADEINRATPRTQSALLEAMQERQVTVDIATHKLPRPFLVLATQNPVELEGTFPLPEAQLDRFLLKVALGYPDADEENDILLRFERVDPLDSLEKVVEPEEILAMQTAVREIRVETSVRNYIVNVCRATRDHEDIELGASPRATMALYRTCQALAAVNGRAFVIPDDVKHMAPFVLTHRLIVNPQTRLRGRKPEQVIAEVVATVPVPVETGN